VALKFKYKQRQCTGSYRNRPIVELKWSTEEGTYSFDDSSLKKYIVDIGRIEDYESPQNLPLDDEPAKNYKGIESMAFMGDETEVKWRITPADNVNAIGNLKNDIDISRPPERRRARLIDETV